MRYIYNLLKSEIFKGPSYGPKNSINNSSIKKYNIFPIYRKETNETLINRNIMVMLFIIFVIIFLYYLIYYSRDLDIKYFIS